MDSIAVLQVKEGLVQRRFVYVSVVYILGWSEAGLWPATIGMGSGWGCVVGGGGAEAEVIKN